MPRSLPDYIGLTTRLCTTLTSDIRSVFPVFTALP